MKRAGNKVVKIVRSAPIGPIDCALSETPSGAITVLIDESLISEEGAAALSEILGSWLATRRSSPRPDAFWPATG